jgi:hypothetical protein
MGAENAEIEKAKACAVTPLQCSFHAGQLPRYVQDSELKGVHDDQRKYKHQLAPYPQECNSFIMVLLTSAKERAYTKVHYDV